VWSIKLCGSNTSRCFQLNRIVPELSAIYAVSNGGQHCIKTPPSVLHPAPDDNQNVSRNLSDLRISRAR